MGSGSLLGAGAFSLVELLVVIAVIAIIAAIAIPNIANISRGATLARDQRNAQSVAAAATAARAAGSATNWTTLQDVMSSLTNNSGAGIAVTTNGQTMMFGVTSVDAASVHGALGYLTLLNPGTNSVVLYSQTSTNAP